MTVTQLSALERQVVLLDIRALRSVLIPPYPRHLFLDILGQVQCHSFLKRVADRFLRLLLLLSGSGFLGTFNGFLIILLRCLQILVVILNSRNNGQKVKI